MARPAALKPSIKATRYSLARPDFKVDPRRLWRMLLAHDYHELPVTSEHTLAVHDLPPLHKAPFDRILIAQV